MNLSVLKPGEQGRITGLALAALFVQSSLSVLRGASAELRTINA